MNEKARARTLCLNAAVMLGLLLSGMVEPAQAGYSQVDPLWFSLSPAGGTKPEAGKPGRPTGRPSGRPSGRPGGGHSAGRFESEHRPIPQRKYYLNSPAEGVQGSVLHPDLSVSELTFDFEGSPSGSTMLAMSDGPHHGANNLYAYDSQVAGSTLHVRSAKWVTIQHSCGWGHGLKFTEERQVSQSLATVPLEIVVDDLWDTNFHSTVMSGDKIHLKVLLYGQPAAGARVTVTSEKGWQKTIVTDQEGAASFQLVRDYYPDGWSKFHRTEKGQIKFTAVYSEQSPGEFQGQNYEDTRYSATFPWRYYPARREYTSLIVGLLIALFGAGLTGAGFFLYRRKRWTGMKRMAWSE